MTAKSKYHKELFAHYSAKQNKTKPSQVKEHWKRKKCNTKCSPIFSISAAVTIQKETPSLWEKQMETHLLSKLCSALCRCSLSSWDTFSPKWARQSSIELSGLAGLNTGEVWQSNPVVVNAERQKYTKENKTDSCKNINSVRFLIPPVNTVYIRDEEILTL